MTTITGNVPGEDVRVVMLPGVVRANNSFGDGAEVPYVLLEGLMRDDFRFPRCRHDDHLQFTITGWRAFLAAVKAGEFDHVVPVDPFQAEFPE